MEPLEWEKARENSGPVSFLIRIQMFYCTSFYFSLLLYSLVFYSCSINLLWGCDDLLGEGEI